MVISGGEAREDCAQPYKDHHGDMDKQGFPFGQAPEPNNPDFRRRFKNFGFIKCKPFAHYKEDPNSCYYSLNL